MAYNDDGLLKGLAYLNLVVSSEFRLKPAQEVAVRALLEEKDVLAVLSTSGYDKGLIYHIFSICAKDYELNGQAAVLVISLLISIIKDQISNK